MSCRQTLRIKGLHALKGASSLKIYTLSGKTLMQIPILPGPEREILVSTDGPLASGLYLYRVINNRSGSRVMGNLLVID